MPSGTRGHRSLFPRTTMTLTDQLPEIAGPDDLFNAFEGWAKMAGLSLYPHQEEALIEIVSGANVILSTPTGSGKSLVAAGAHFTALARGERSFYTAPVKALVSEKFFALCDMFGADRVGMMTGDASVNADAPIICCTAEILANIALRDGAQADVGQVIMDEFHFYADPDRGWAWQVPLIELTRAQFLLMSATLGDVSRFELDLSRRTGRPTAAVRSSERPVPVLFSYVSTPLHETLEELLATRQAPVYIVHFTQAAAVEQAQALMSVNVCTRAEKDAIAELIGNFRFTAGFGKTLSRLVRHGIGVHHAGMLPRYRRLVETLAQAGLLKVICGTDTLGVGINVPIRTVLMTSLSKYDGSVTRLLPAREFHQIAGGVVEKLAEPDQQGRMARLTVDLQDDFALNQPLSPLALAAIELLDASLPDYPLDVLSVIESTLDNPRPVLAAQLFRAKGEAVAEMKAEGLDYETRTQLLEEVSYPRPLADLLESAYQIYSRGHPWVADYELAPKSVARDMYERAMTFSEYIARCGLARSEGLLLRYLADAYKALRQTVPDEAKTDELADLIEWLGEMVRQVDSSLLDEWGRPANPDGAEAVAASQLDEPPPAVTGNVRAFRVLVRNALFRRVELAALRRWDELGELDQEAGWDANAWADALEPYFTEHEDIGTGSDARGPAMLIIDDADSGVWRVRQIFDDPAGDHDWGFSAEVDLAGSDEAGEAVIWITAVGQL